MEKRIRTGRVPVSDERTGKERTRTSVAQRLERQGEGNGRTIGNGHLHDADGIVCEDVPGTDDKRSADDRYDVSHAILLLSRQNRRILPSEPLNNLYRTSKSPEE